MKGERAQGNRDSITQVTSREITIQLANNFNQTDTILHLRTRNNKMEEENKNIEMTQITRQNIQGMRDKNIINPTCKITYKLIHF